MGLECVDGLQLPLRAAADDGIRRWQAQARRSLEIVSGWLDDPAQLCLENIERWDPAAFAPIVEELPISRCIDVGHLWVQVFQFVNGILTIISLLL